MEDHRVLNHKCCWRAEKGKYATFLGMQAVGPNAQLAISAEGPQPVRTPGFAASLLFCQLRCAASLLCFQVAQRGARLSAFCPRLSASAMRKLQSCPADALAPDTPCSGTAVSTDPCCVLDELNRC